MKSASVLARALILGAIVALTISALGSAIGFLLYGVPGLLSALFGAALAALFMGLTTLSIVIADRATQRSPSTSRYFQLVVGMWALKFFVFVAILLVLSQQPWISPYIFFFALVAAVIGSLVADVIAFTGARVPYVGDIQLSGRANSAADSPNRRD